VPARRYTEQQFRTAVADPEVRTLADLCRALGIVPRGANYETLRRYAARLDVDLTSIAPPPRRRPDIDPSALEDVVANARSLAGVLRGLGLPITGAMYSRVKREIAAAGLSTTHFDGQGWSRGKTFPEQRKPVEECLRRDHHVRSSWLRGRLIEEGLLEPRCDRCRRRRWLDVPIPLELDHIDGDRTNNLLENLRVLCPNCHALTPTYRGRNIGRTLPAPPDGPLHPDAS
jgi:hypothetical protein